MSESATPAQAQEVLQYWFGPGAATTATELQAKLRRWFGDAQVASEVRERFTPIIESAAQGVLQAWEDTPLGKLALIVVSDQLRRSSYGMDDARAFAEDRRAAALALELAEQGIPDGWSAEQHFFALVPLGHAEDRAMHKVAVAQAVLLVERAPQHLRPIFETVTNQLIRFISVIERFGRFPHRNAALGRESTAEEIEFLKNWQIRHPAHGYGKQFAIAQEIEGKRDREDKK